LNIFKSRANGLEALTGELVCVVSYLKESLPLTRVPTQKAALLLKQDGIRINNRFFPVQIFSNLPCNYGD